MYDFGIVGQQPNRPRRDRVSASFYKLEAASQHSPLAQHFLVVALGRCFGKLDDNVNGGIRIKILKFPRNFQLAGHRQARCKNEDRYSGQLFDHLPLLFS